MDPHLEAILAQKRNQAIAIILSVKEEECDDYLPDEASRALRKVILDQINGLHNLAHDLLKSTSSVDLNQYYLDLISELHDAVVGEDRD